MIEVVHCKKVPDCIYIGRPNPLGNPFTHKKGTKAEFIVETRELAVEAYRNYIWTKLKEKDEAIINEFKKLKALALTGELKLGCWCAPQACHGDVVKDLIERSILQDDARKKK